MPPDRTGGRGHSRESAARSLRAVAVRRSAQGRRPPWNGQDRQRISIASERCPACGCLKPCIWVSCNERVSRGRGSVHLRPTVICRLGEFKNTKMTLRARLGWGLFAIALVLIVPLLL